MAQPLKQEDNDNQVNSPDKNAAHESCEPERRPTLKQSDSGEGVPENIARIISDPKSESKTGAGTSGAGTSAPMPGAIREKSPTSKKLPPINHDSISPTNKKDKKKKGRVRKVTPMEMVPQIEQEKKNKSTKSGKKKKDKDKDKDKERKEKDKDKKDRDKDKNKKKRQPEETVYMDPGSDEESMEI